MTTLKNGDIVCLFDELELDSLGVIVPMLNLGSGFVCVNWNIGCISVHAENSLITIHRPYFKKNRGISNA